MKLHCSICPHDCLLDEGEVGKCSVICHSGSKLVHPYYGKCSIITVDAIEKRPFFHFYPGSKFLSVGFYGCNFKCDFCQNFRVSQTTEGKFSQQSPDDLLDLARVKKVHGIAFSFNEPTIHYPYLEDIAVQNFINRDMKLVIKTNGFVSHSTLRNLCLFYDAFNVDIKGDEEEYDRVCGGSLEPVLDAIELIVEMERHLEISYLVLPRILENKDHHAYIRDWISSIDKDIPFHILYCYPFHKMNDSYKMELILPVVDFFREELRHVYVSNIHKKPFLSMRNTVCPDCKGLLVDRSGGSVVLHRTKCCNNEIIRFSETD